MALSKVKKMLSDSRYSWDLKILSEAVFLGVSAHVLILVKVRKLWRKEFWDYCSFSDNKIDNASKNQDWQAEYCYYHRHIGTITGQQCISPEENWC